MPETREKRFESETELREKKTSGSSDRLNFLCDKAGFAPAGDGRATELAEFCVSNGIKVTRLATRKWIQDDVVPQKLEKIVEALLKRMRSHANPSLTARWVYTGNDTYHPTRNAHVRYVDDEVPANIMISVHLMSRKMGIDIEHLSQDKVRSKQKLLKLYAHILEVCKEASLSEPSERIVKSALELISIE